MQIHIDDDGFVRAPAPDVYRFLTDVARWPAWWPGVRVTPVDAPDETYDLALRAGRRTLRVRAVCGEWRLDTGFRMTLTGDVAGVAEFWLERGWGGTVVHHVVVGESSARRPRAVLAGYRRALRRGLWAAKDHLQSAQREDAGWPA
ncbi:MAG: SRPBCC family protein [Actinomycetes bacterium]